MNLYLINLLTISASPTITEIPLIVQESEPTCDLDWLQKETNESKLQNLAPNTWAYRLITVGSWLGELTTIRIQSTPESEPQLIAYKLDVLSPWHVAKPNSRQLSSAETAEFRRRLEKLKVFDLPVNDGVRGSDGSWWYFEAVENGRYHCIKRWSPRIWAEDRKLLPFIEIIDWMFNAAS